MQVNVEIIRLLRLFGRVASRASVALAIDTGDQTRPFDTAFWLEWPWEYDPVIEKTLEEEHSKVLKLPGRNDPCQCGSGRKFKKCCIGKVSVLRC